jgi:hypothetical protein
MENENEDILKRHIEKNVENVENKSINRKVNIKTDLGEKISDSEYIGYDVNILPAGIFYPEGTMLLVKPATTKDIMNYSSLDETNIMDTLNKMKNLISSCVKIKYPDGVKYSSEYLFQADFYYVLFLINELTRIKNNNHYEVVKCTSCKDINVNITT